MFVWLVLLLVCRFRVLVGTQSLADIILPPLLDFFLKMKLLFTLMNSCESKPNQSDPYKTDAPTYRDWEIGRAHV